MKNFLFIMVLFAFCNHASAKHEKPLSILRSFTINRAYYDERPFNSNDMMKDLPLSIMQLSTKGFDVVTQRSNNFWYKFLCGCLYGPLQYSLAYLNNVTYHEFGHARAYSSHGIKYIYGSSLENKNITTSDAFGIYIKKLKNPTEFFAGAYVQPLPETLADLLKFGDEKIMLTVNVAGLNNQMRYAQAVADRIYENKGHFFYLFDYSIGKLSTADYVVWFKEEVAKGNVSAGNDINNAVNNYKKLGLKISEEDMSKGSLISFFLSSTTWCFLYSAFNNLPKGDFTVHAPVWKGWRLPDVNFYMTTKGLSYEIITGYELNSSWYIGLSTEFIFKGQSFYEWGPVVTYKMQTTTGTYTLTGQTTLSQYLDLGCGASCDWLSPNKIWGIEAKYIRHNASTLVGERNIPFIKNGHIGNEFIFSARFIY
jgi:hypothetical protein